MTEEEELHLCLRIRRDVQRLLSEGVDPEQSRTDLRILLVALLDEDATLRAARTA